MRLLIAALAMAACTAVTDFSQFQPGAPAVDMAYHPGAFGEPCDPAQPMPCQPGQSAPNRALMCQTSLGSHSVPGNICTRECIAAANACTDYGNATCVMFGTLTQPNYCIPTCNLPSLTCRQGLSCCTSDGHPVSSGPGGCAPYCP